MKLKQNFLFPISGLLMTFFMSNYAEAAYTKYAKIGSENASNYSFKAASTGEVKAYFVGSVAGYINDVSMLVNGVDTGKHGLVNNKFGTLTKATYGQSFSFGNVNKGDRLVFRLNVNLDKPAVNRVYYSDKTMNIDGMSHVYSAPFTTDNIIPNGTYISFEDLSKTKSYNLSGYVCDFNYSDENFVFTNVGVETVDNCPTLSALSATIPSYALSNDSSQIRICHNDTSKKINPFTLSMISFSALNAHLNNHGDYFTTSGICPTDSEPCPSLPSVCPAPLVFNADKTACTSQAIPVKPTVTPVVTTDNQTAKLVGGSVGTSIALTIEIKDSNGESKASGSATLSGIAPNQTWTYLPPVLPANGNANAIYQVTATGDSAHGSLIDTNTDELI